MNGSMFDFSGGMSRVGDWERRKLRSILTPRSERQRPDLPLLTVARERGAFVRSADDDNHNAIPEDLSNYKVARAGDLVINKMKAWQGSLGLAPVDGIVSPAYFVFQADFAVSRFGEYLLRSKPYVAMFGAASDGIRVGQWDLNIPRMRNIEVVLPPADEQAAIVRYLTHAGTRIDKAIAAKRRLIALLGEQRRAMIDEVVTAGHRWHGAPNDGGYPSAWRVIPFLRTVIERADYRGATPEKVDAGVPLVTAKNVRSGWIDYDSSKEYVRAEDYPTIMRRGLPKIGDILLTMEAPLGNVALVDDEEVAFAQRVVRFRTDPDVLRPGFAVIAMNSTYFQNQLAMRATGSTAQGIKASKLPEVVIALPPANEQDRLIQRVRHRTAAISKASLRAQHEVGLLGEFRARLIADVVTDQVDVRSVAAGLTDQSLNDIGPFGSGVEPPDFDGLPEDQD